MKRIILLIICTCFTLAVVHAQGPRDKIKTLKVAYITDKLQLNSGEAEKFWPVYNAHEEKMQEYRMQKFGEIRRRLRNNIDNIAEADAKKMLDEMEAAEERIHIARKQLIKDLKKVISAKKILLLKQAEDDFNKHLLNKLREQRKKRFNNRN